MLSETSMLITFKKVIFHHTLYLILFTYKGCSVSNALYFVLWACDVRGGWWWYGGRSWTFPPIFHYVLLLCVRWQQRGSLTKRSMTWKCVWSKDVELNSSVKEKCYPLTFIDAYWMFMRTKQWMWVQWGSGWCISAVVPVTVGHFCSCRFSQARHAGSCWSQAKM